MDRLVNIYIWFWWAWKRQPNQTAPLEPEQRNRVLCFFLFYFVFVIVVFFFVNRSFSYLASPPSEGEVSGHYQNIYNNEIIDSVLDLRENDETDFKQDIFCCGESEQEKSNNFRKDKRDLNAQEGMWRSANALVVLTSFQLGVGIFTMWMLYLTFKTQRNELCQAKRAADAAVIAARANLLPEITASFDKSSDKKYFLASICIVNLGNAPALQVDYDVSYSRTKGREFISDSMDQLCQKEFNRVVRSQGKLKLRSMPKFDTFSVTKGPGYVDDPWHLGFRINLKYDDGFGMRRTVVSEHWARVEGVEDVLDIQREESLLLAGVENIYFSTDVISNTAKPVESILAESAMGRA